MNPFILSSRQRLDDWTQFRKSLSGISLEEQLDRVVEYWSQAPLVNFAYDENHFDDLPTPWEMITEGNWCRDSVAVGMEFTLRLAGVDGCILSLIHDDVSSQRLVVLRVGDWVLNMEYGTKIKIPSSAQILSHWEWDDKARSYKEYKK